MGKLFPAEGEWHVEMLGGLRAYVPQPQSGHTLVDRFRTKYTGALLAYLACHLYDAPRAREHVREVIWPDVADKEALQNNLSIALNSLRKQLEPPGVPSGTVLVADRLTVRLNPGVVTTDVAEFKRALKAADAAKGSTDALLHLAAAADLYRGDLLPGLDSLWVEEPRRELQTSFFEALYRLQQHLEKSGELARAISYARRTLALDPYREESCRNLMRLLAAAGEPAAALQAFRELERLLKKEGDEPSGTLRAYARELELRPTTRRPAADDPPALERPPSPLPTGTVTFLLTDIVGSVSLAEQNRLGYAAAREAHHALLREEFARHHGSEVKEIGDAFLVAFGSARDALAVAIACQQSLATATWPEGMSPIMVRMLLHTGDVFERNGDYHDPVVNRAFRMVTAGHGGQILCSETTAALLRRGLEEEAQLTDLGVYRLRDVPSPERLFQVEYPGMPRHDFGPLNAPPAFTPNLPYRPGRFFGRDRELARIEELLAPGGEVRLVTLTGMGGAGKTRLAMKAAERLAEAYRGAVFFVPLADLPEPDLFADEVLRALSTSRAQEEDPLEKAVEVLSKQPSLLLLDSFEKLAETQGTAVQELLARAPTLTCLVTSRRLLGLAPELERELPVPPLPTPAHPDTPEGLGQYDAVRLFIDRAQGVRPDFQVTNSNAPAVAELCHRLEGIPLSIELAAARASMLTPAQMLAKLENRLEFLVSRKRGVDPRHLSLRAVLDVSYGLLPAELQHFFARLGVFHPSFSVEAAEVVTEEALAQDYMAELRENSLLVAEEGKRAMRFLMLETIRDYALEQCSESGDLDATREQHTGYYLSLLRQAQMEGPEKGAWLDRLSEEWDNFLAAFYKAAEEVYADPEACDEEAVSAVLSALMPLMITCLETRRWGPYPALMGQFWMLGSLSENLSTEPPDPVVEAQKGAYGRGCLCLEAGDWEGAEAAYQQALSLAEQRLPPDDQGPSLSFRDRVEYYGPCSSVHEQLAQLRRLQGRLREALEEAEQALAWARRVDSEVLVGPALATRVDYQLACGELEGAVASCSEAIETASSMDPWTLARSLVLRAECRIHQGDWDSARQDLEAAWALLVPMAEMTSVVGALGNLARWWTATAELRDAEGDLAGAVEARRAVVKHRRHVLEDCVHRPKDPFERKTLAIALDALGSALRRAGEEAEAAATLRESRSLFDASGLPSNAVDG